MNKNRTLHRLFYCLAFACLACLFFKGCGPKAKSIQTGLIQLTESEYPQFDDDMNLNELDSSIQQSLKYLSKVPADRKFAFGSETVDAAQIKRTLEDFLKLIYTRPSADEINRYIRARYRVYQSSGRNSEREVLFTGYFEPMLRGSLTRSETYPFPVYAPPDDMITIDLSLFSSKFEGEKIIGRFTGKTVLPYYERKEIEEDFILSDKADVVAWVDDRVDLFFLHIQGSGKIKLDDGRTLHIHYHSKNGRPYRSVGQLLIDEKKVSLEDMSMQAIKSYLREHPEDISGVLNHNPSYIFFSVEKDGPYGALNVVLTPKRSIAVDRAIFPLSALAFVQTQKPLTDQTLAIEKWIPCSRFVTAQDTGGAIKGAGRVDMFWGSGAYAELAAGHMRHTGNLYFLLLKSDK